MNYFIGLDYGTSFTKCLVRNEDTTEVWPVLPRKSEPENISDLFINSEIIAECDNVKCAFVQKFEPEALPAKGQRIIRNLKMALVAASRDEWDSSWLADVAQFTPSKSTRIELRRYIERLVAFYLAHVVNLALDSIKERATTFDPKGTDKVGLHLSVPVAYRSDKKVMKAFTSVATKSIQFAISHFGKVWPGGPQILAELARIKGMRQFANRCVILPEVNAAITSFIQSRSRRTGVYFVADIGAGTIDMSVFNYNPALVIPVHFFGADVRDLGSAQLEIRAIERLERAALPTIRDYKVKGSMGARTIHIEEFCDLATKEIREEVTQAAVEVLNGAVKLYGRSNDMLALSRIFVGGGGEDQRYRIAIRDAVERMHLGAGGIEHIPVPEGSESIHWPRTLRHESHNCFRRFTVAFGLSFNPASFFPTTDVKTSLPKEEDAPRSSIDEWRDT